MPIEFNDEQVVVSCKGDIMVLGFDPRQEACDGVAWLLFQEGEEGEPGRPVPDGVIGSEVWIHKQKGVLVAAADPRSLTAIIDGLTILREQLEELK